MNDIKNCSITCYDGEEMYQKAIVTFIDILGFGNLVKQFDADGINRVLDAIKKSTFPVQDDMFKTNDHAEVVSFSDSIVRIRKIETETNQKYPTGLFFHELISLVQAQGQLIGDDIIVRGGVSIGDIYISGSRAFGPGLIKAYELESKYALYPRIIIDPHVIQEYKTNELLKAKWHSVEDELEIAGSLLKQGDDGMWFINYAVALKSELDELEMYPNFLQKHREVIVSGAKKYATLNAILVKFVWMAYYHNQIISNMHCEAFEVYDLNKDDFIITSEEIPALQYMTS